MPSTEKKSARNGTVGARTHPDGQRRTELAPGGQENHDQDQPGSSNGSARRALRMRDRNPRVKENGGDAGDQQSEDEEEEEMGVGRTGFTGHRKSGGVRGVKRVVNYDDDKHLKEEYDDLEYRPNRGLSFKRRKGSYSESKQSALKKKKNGAANSSFSAKARSDMDDNERKEFSDDVSEMCLCKCNICGKDFLHHRMLKHIERTHKQGSKDKFQFIKLSHYRCKLCDQEILFSYYNIGQHVKRCHKMSLEQYKLTVKGAFRGELPFPHGDEVEGGKGGEEEGDPLNPATFNKVFSDDLMEMCRIKCNLCSRVLFYHQIRSHVSKEHQEETDRYGKYNFDKKTYYKCKICDAAVLFNFESITQHCLLTHNISLKQYKAEHSDAFSGQQAYNRYMKRQWSVNGSSSRTVVRRKKRAEYGPELVDLWRETVTGNRKYVSDNLEEMCLKRCKICEEIIPGDSVKYHLQSEHRELMATDETHNSTTNSEDKEAVNGDLNTSGHSEDKETAASLNARNHEYIRLTYHRCRLCHKDLLFTFTSVSKHTKRWHKLNFKEYDQVHNVFNNGLFPGRFCAAPPSKGSAAGPKLPKLPKKLKAHKLESLDGVDGGAVKRRRGRKKIGAADGFFPPGDDPESSPWHHPAFSHLHHHLTHQTPPPQQQAQQQPIVKLETPPILYDGSNMPIARRSRVVLDYAAMPLAGSHQNNGYTPPSHHHHLQHHNGRSIYDDRQKHLMTDYVKNMLENSPPFHLQHHQMEQLHHQQQQQQQQQHHQQQLHQQQHQHHTLQQQHRLLDGGVHARLHYDEFFGGNHHHQQQQHHHHLNPMTTSSAAAVTLGHNSTGVAVTSNITVSTASSSSSDTIITPLSVPGSGAAGGLASSGLLSPLLESSLSAAVAASVAVGMPPTEPTSAGGEAETSLPPSTAASAVLSGSLPQASGHNPTAGNHWYDGNTFQCRQCGYTTRSLEQTEAHTNTYHQGTGGEAAITKTEIFYRCQVCFQDVYHEKTSIRNHLQLHQMNLDSYSQLYEKNKTSTTTTTTLFL